MKRCRDHKTAYVPGKTIVTITLEDRAYKREVDAMICPECGDDSALVSNGEMERAELEVARRLAYNGEVTAEAFRFMRHALSFSGEELAGVLGTTKETISRWERKEHELPRPAWLAVAGMVLDRLDRRTVIHDIADAADRPKVEHGEIRL